MALLREFQSNFSFAWPLLLPYLVTLLSSIFNFLYRANFPPLFKELYSLPPGPPCQFHSLGGSMFFAWFICLSSYCSLGSCGPCAHPVPSYILHKLLLISIHFALSPSVAPRDKTILSYVGGGIGSPQPQSVWHPGPIALFHAVSEVPIWMQLVISECSPFPIYNLLWTPPMHWPWLQDLSFLHAHLWDAVKYSGNLISPHLLFLGILKTLQFFLAYKKSFMNF